MVNRALYTSSLNSWHQLGREPPTQRSSMCICCCWQPLKFSSAACGLGVAESELLRSCFLRRNGLAPKPGFVLEWATNDKAMRWDFFETAAISGRLAAHDQNDGHRQREKLLKCGRNPVGNGTRK